MWTDRPALAHPKSAGLSDREIAKHVGVSQQCVSGWRSKSESSYKLCKIGEPTTRTAVRNGKEYQIKVDNIGKTPRPQPVADGLAPGWRFLPCSHAHFFIDSSSHLLIYLGMANTPSKRIKVSKRALLQRIKRKLAHDGDRVITMREDKNGLLRNPELGKYLRVNSYNHIVDGTNDLEWWGKKEEVLAEWEEMETDE